jgi:hypothetical protein
VLQFKERVERIREAKREEKQPRAKMIRSTRHTQRLDEIKRQHKTIRKRDKKLNADIVEIVEEKKEYNDDGYDVPEGGQLNTKECAFFFSFSLYTSIFRSKRKGLDLL